MKWDVREIEIKDDCKLLVEATGQMMVIFGGKNMIWRKGARNLNYRGRKRHGLCGRLL